MLPGCAPAGVQAGNMPALRLAGGSRLGLAIWLPFGYPRGMNEPRYREAIAEYIRAQARPPDKLPHQPRLYHLAKSLAEGQNYDDDVLYAAAWMHDLGVFHGHRPEDPAALAAWDHVAYAMTEVPPLLRQFGFPEEKIPRAIEAIRTHLPSSHPTTIEGTLLRDADLLEQLGAVGILRTVSKVGRDTRFVRLADALAALRRNVEQIPSKLRLASARRLAQARVEILRAFLDAATSEADGIEF
jgi:uncharacterized protein